jgi:glycosyltransferase involved in cell wall biosynthesis
MNTKVVIPWHNAGQLAAFLSAWGISADEESAIFQQDKTREGCARTKNRGIKAAMEAGAEVVIVLDDDCYPENGQTFAQFIQAHEQALNPQPVELFAVVTDPPSRGTPYFNRTVTMPVAACMGFWTHVGDYDAPGQLVHGATKPMMFKRQAIYGRYFPLCGMNLAFRVSEWPWCQFIDVPRLDDIWQGFLWQRRAFADGKCFNLYGPFVRHSRQSNVWKNLLEEAKNLERNETLWQDIVKLPLASYEAMKAAVGLP